MSSNTKEEITTRDRETALTAKRAAQAVEQLLLHAAKGRQMDAQTNLNEALKGTLVAHKH